MTDFFEKGEEVKKLSDIISKTFKKSKIGPENEAQEDTIEKTIKHEEKEIKRLRDIMTGKVKDKKGKNELKDLEKELADIKKKKKTTLKDIGQIDQDLKNNTKTLDEKKQKLDEVAREIAGLTEKIDKPKKDIPIKSELKKELETKKSESEAKDKVIEEYVKKIRGEYDKLEKELRDARNTLLTLTEEVEEIPGKIHEIDEKLAKNTRQLDEDKKQLILIEKDSNKAKTNLDSNLNTRDIIKDGYDKEVEKMRKIEDKFKVYEKIEKQPEEIKYLKQRVAEALNTIPKIEEEREELIKKDETNKKRLEEIKKTKNTIEDELSRLKDLKEQFIEEESHTLKHKSKGELEDIILAQKDKLIDCEKEEKKKTKEKKNLLFNLKNAVEKKDKLQSVYTEIIDEGKRILEELKNVTGKQQEENIKIPAKLEEKMTNARYEIDSLQSKMEKLSSEEEELKEKITKATRILRDAEQEKNALIKVKKTKKQVTKKQKNIKTKILKDIAEREREFEEIPDEIRCLDEEIKKSAERINSITQEAELLKVNVEKNKKAIEEKVDELRVIKHQKVMSWTKDMFALDLLYPIKELYDIITDEKSKLKVRLDWLKNKDITSSAKLMKIEEAVKDSEAGVKNLDDEMAEIQVRLEKLEKEDKELKEDRVKKELRLKDIAIQIPPLEKDVIELTHREDDISGRLDEKTKEKYDIEEKRKDIEEELAGLNVELEAEERDLLEYESKLEEKHTQILGLKSDIEHLDKSILKQLIDKQEKKDELDELEREEDVTELRVEIVKKFDKKKK